MEIIIQKDSQSAARLAARLIADTLRANPSSVLGLATGRTMEEVYAFLVEDYKSGLVDFSQVETFNLDEYIGLEASDANSYHHYMNEKLFRHVNINLANCHLPNGAAEDIERECLEYEERIAACGGIDLQLLGLGRSGHIGFNEPLSALLSRTRAKVLTPITIEQNATLFADASLVPKRAITVGIGTILDSRRCLMVVTGREKADILAKAVEGPIASRIPATALQLHSRCTVIVDEAAAALLQEQEYYRWVFNTEPEWAEYR